MRSLRWKKGPSPSSLRSMDASPERFSPAAAMCLPRLVIPSKSSKWAAFSGLRFSTKHSAAPTFASQMERPMSCSLSFANEVSRHKRIRLSCPSGSLRSPASMRSEEHTSELQSRLHLVCRLLLEKKNLRKNPPPMRHVLTLTESGQTSSSGNPGTLSCTDLKSAQSFSTFDASQVRRSGARCQPKLESNLDYSRDWWIGDPTAFLLDLRGVTNCSEFTRILAVEQERRERYGTSR